MDDNTFSIVEPNNNYQLAEFVIDTIKENPFAVALGILGLCIGVFLDNKINLNGGK